MFSGKSEQWKMVARALKRPLNHQWADADSVVRIVSDPSCRQGFRQEVIAPVGEILGKELPSDWEYTFDFGRYCVGYPVIVLDYHGIFDAPFRLEYKLAETPYECQFDFAEPGLCHSFFENCRYVLERRRFGSHACQSGDRKPCSQLCDRASYGT